MYDNPADAKRRRVTLRLDQKEHALILALANTLGEQPAALIRDMVMEQAEQVAQELRGKPVAQRLIA